MSADNVATLNVVCSKALLVTYTIGCSMCVYHTNSYTYWIVYNSMYLSGLNIDNCLF